MLLSQACVSMCFVEKGQSSQLCLFLQVANSGRRTPTYTSIGITSSHRCHCQVNSRKVVLSLTCVALTDNEAVRVETLFVVANREEFRK